MPLGTFERTITLPQGANTSKVSASFHNGVLELTVPGAEKIQPRRIEIKAGKEQPQLTRSAA
jgi:HSP20 family protein